MPNFEVLSRASATIFKPPVSSKRWQSPVTRADKRRALIVSSLHVAYPFLFPQYYDQEWLKLVEPKHVKFSLELRNEKAGTPERRITFIPSQTLMHASRDLIAFETELDDSETDDVLMLDLDQICTYREREQILCLGHRVCESELDDDDSSYDTDAVMYPQTVPGETVTRMSVNQRKRDSHESHFESIQQVFAMTEKTLEMGMCGGPVLAKSDKKPLGIIEGIVHSGKGQALENHVAIIEMQQISEWLSREWI